MLQRLRDGLQGQKWLAALILGLIGATFVFWGGSSSLDFSGVSTNAAAEVDGQRPAGIRWAWRLQRRGRGLSTARLSAASRRLETATMGRFPGPLHLDR